MSIFKTKPVTEPSPAALAPAEQAQAAADQAAAEFTAAQAEVAAANQAVAFAADPANFTDADEGLALVAQVAAVRAAAERQGKAAVAANRASAKKAKTAEAADAAQALAFHEKDEALNAALSVACAAFMAGAANAADYLLPGIPGLRGLFAERSRVDAELAARGLPVRPPVTELVGALPGLLDPRPGHVGALASALAAMDWAQGEELRAREAKANADRMAADAQRHHDRLALAGHLGPEERQAAEARRSQALASFYGTNQAPSWAGEA